MNPFSTIAKRFLLAGSLVLMTACGSNGVTDPTADRSGYLTVSATVKSGYNVPAKPVPTTTTTTTTTEPSGGSTTNSGYNVTAF